MTSEFAVALRSPPAKREVTPELDGVRGIAILMVLVFHFNTYQPISFFSLATFPVSVGWSGVDLFFVLSGFLITRILLDTRDSPNYLSSFYARRVLRIFPLYLLLVSSYFVVALPAAHHFGYWQERNDLLQWWYWMHLSNWQSAFGHDVALLSHLWSLSIEEQFYLVWPLVVLLVRPGWMIRVCLTMICAPLVLRLVYMHDGWVLLQRFTPFRVDSLAVGCLIALLVRDPRWRRVIEQRFRRIATLAVAFLLFVLLMASSPRGRAAYDAPLMITLGYTAFALAYGCLVIFAYHYTGSPSWLAARLRGTVLRAFGKHSYAIYVIHWPLAVFATGLLAKYSTGAAESRRIALWTLSISLGILSSFVLSKVSWHLLEKHCLRLKDRFVAG